MEPVKLASGIGGHGPQILYPGSRQPPPVHPQPHSIIHPSSNSRHEGSPYKGAISPPVVSRSVPYSSYASMVEGAHGGLAAHRYLQHPTYIAYQRDSHFSRSMSERPVMLPQAPKRPSIMAGYGGYTRDMIHMLPTSTVPVSLSGSGAPGGDHKRIKLNPPPKPPESPRFPQLVIDTETNHSSSRDTSYYPQVEQISPTLPPDPRDESPLHATRDDLMKQIEGVDKEIAMTDASLSTLRKKEKELEAAELKGDSGPQAEAEEQQGAARTQSTAQVIYAENRKVAEEGHNALSKLIPPSEMPRVLPLYHQPSDTEVYHQNKAKYSVFKRRLLEYFKKRQHQKVLHDRQVAQTYTKLTADWLKRVDKAENCKRHKERVWKQRELFEKVFPELRKAREDRERFSRVGARVKSDAEMEEIIDGLQDQENEDKKMRAYAVIPPVLLDETRRSLRYTNSNSLVEDPLGEHMDRRNVNVWTPLEEEVFREKYLHHPKNFVVIGSYVERKSVTDCIQHYYLTKKKQNYKTLVKRRMRRPRGKANPQPNPGESSIVTLNSSGVTTRGSAAAAYKVKNAGGPASAVDDADSATPVISWPQSSIMAVAGPPGPSALANPDSGPAVVPPSGPELDEKDKENLSATGNKSSRRDRNETHESTDEENAAEHGGGGAHECALCRARLEHFGQSRPIGAGNAAQYGLSESAVEPGARVCANCRCRSVKRRVPQCQIPTCTTPKWRVKRLRPFPSRWDALPSAVKESVVKELEIPAEVTKSCSACHNRIMRKLGPLVEEPLDPALWSEAEIQAIAAAIREVGCHWTRVSGRVRGKSPGQCWTFFKNLKEKYHLDAALAEYRKSKGKSGPPTVTDEEESGSSTSSCEDGSSVPPSARDKTPGTGAGHITGPAPGPRSGHPRHDSASDTASASSPSNSNEDRSKESVREVTMKEVSGRGVTCQDNDSSATASADEGQTGLGGRESPPEVQHIPHPGERRVHTNGYCKMSGPPGGQATVRASGGTPTPPVTASSPVPAASPARNIKHIIDSTIEATIKRSSKNHRGHGSGDASDPPSHNDHITISSLLENSSSYAGKTGIGGGAATFPPPSAAQAQEAAERPRSRAERDRHAAVVAVAQQQYDDCEGGLDLTVRKRDRSPPPPAVITMRGGAEVTPVPLSTAGMGSPPRAHSNSISYSQPPHNAPLELTRGYLADFRKSPGFAEVGRGAPHTAMVNLSGGSPSPHLTVSHTSASLLKTTKSVMAPPSLPSAPRVTLTQISPSVQPSLANRVPLKTDKGPITVRGAAALNTVPSSAGRYEILTKLPLITREGGSITQGTPIHEAKRAPLVSHQKDAALLLDSRSAVEIIPRPAPAAAAQIYDRDSNPGAYHGRLASTTSYPPSSLVHASFSFAPTGSRVSYSDSQIASRQIIETDYQTSQQMANRRDRDLRASPRVRESASIRDHHRAGGYAAPAVYDRRAPEPARSDHHRPDNLAAATDSDKLRKFQYAKTVHGYVPIHGGSTQTQSSAQIYPPGSVDVRVSRPSPLVVVRDTAATPPSAGHGTVSPHRDFRPPSGAVPAPVRSGSVIHRQSSSAKYPTAHYGSSSNKSASPRPEGGDRYSPLNRHLTVLPSGEPLNMADPLHRQTAAAGGASYPSGLELRREISSGGRPSPANSHERHQLDGLGKQVAETVHGGRASFQSAESGDGDLHLDARRYYDPRGAPPLSRHKDEYRPVFAKHPPTIKDLQHQSEELEAVKAAAASSKASGVTSRRASEAAETLTAANLIDAIISSHISQNQIEEIPPRPDNRYYRRGESDGPPPGASDHEKRRPSPAPPGHYHALKDKEAVINIEAGSDLSLHARQLGHKAISVASGLYPVASHPSYSKPLASTDHAAPIDLKKLPPASAHHYVSRGAAPLSHMAAYYDPAKARSQSGPPLSSEKPGSGHNQRNNSPGGVATSEERPIVRISQPPSGGSGPPRSDNPFDYIKNKLQEIWREDTPLESSEKRGAPLANPHDSAKPPQNRSLTPVSRHSHSPSPGATRVGPPYDDEIAKKRPRLDLSESPRGPLDAKDDGGVDSPQSGEMIIDETPQAKDGSKPASHAHQESSNPDKNRPPPPPVSQYPNSYPPQYRGNPGPPASNHLHVRGIPGAQISASSPRVPAWKVSAVLPPASTAAPGAPAVSVPARNSQGYEPNVEPVSDDD